jgi:hypothetical protein
MWMYQFKNRTVSKNVTLKINALIVFAVVVCNCQLLFAQQALVSAKLDTNQIKIGMQTGLLLRVIAPAGVKVSFPIFSDSIVSHVEIVSQGKIDTAIAPGGAQYEMQKKIIITSFDSGFYAIPPFQFIINNDSANVIATEALLLGVQTVAVDTTLAIKSIKGPIEPAWSFKEILNEIIIGITILLAVILVVYFLIKRKKKKPVKEEVIIKISAHEKALTALEILQNQKLWQQGQVKQYHIQLSDIVRTYIEDRFTINALEMTSDEILKSLRHIVLQDEWKLKLSRMLILNDMVKFAKETPLPNENDWCMETAIDFVKSHITQSPATEIKEATNE